MPASDSASTPFPLACRPYGVGHQGEGVCLLVEMGPYRILLDCGLRDPNPLLTEKTPPADLVFCSHAHQDHTRSLLALAHHFPQLPIYASEVTAQLLPFHWQEQSQDLPELSCRPLPWRSPIAFFPDLTAQIFPAGHLPGAAAILLTYTTPERAYTVLYTGDFFLSNSRLVEGLSLETLRGSAPDVLIIEGSYGAARYPRRRQLEKQFLDQIERGIQNQTSVVIFAPPLGLAQEIVMLLRSHHQFTGRNLEIWVGERVAQACDSYLEILPHLPAAVQNFARHQPLFWDEEILPKLGRLTSETVPKSPFILLTDRFSDWQQLQRRFAQNWRALIPTTQEEVIVDRQTLSQRTNVAVEPYVLPDHSDGRNTTQLIHNIRPQHIVFVHGTAAAIAALTSLEELQNRYKLHAPSAGMRVELLVGDRFIQPATPLLTTYEGEITELDANVHFALPSALSNNPNWSSFADTGLIEARWQGNELILRGLSQRELLRQSSVERIQVDLECCRNCEYLRGQTCGNSQSPLCGFPVTLEGYCPAFEPVGGG